MLLNAIQTGFGQVRQHRIFFFERIYDDIKTKQAVRRCNPFSEKEDFVLQGHLRFT